MTNLKINHLQHVGIPVTDIEISQSFYERLGFQRAMNATFMHEGDQGKVSTFNKERMAKSITSLLMWMISMKHFKY